MQGSGGRSGNASPFARCLHTSGKPDSRQSGSAKSNATVTSIGAHFDWGNNRFSLSKLLVRPIWEGRFRTGLTTQERGSNNGVTRLALKIILGSGIVRVMKNISHSFKSVAAFCAVAVLSFTAFDNAQAKGTVEIGPVPTVAPSTETGGALLIQPVPPAPAPVDSGTFNGTVMD